MKTNICKQLKIEYPIFAFSHCRDVVVAVSKAGGFGVLGAVGFSQEQLKDELDWIDNHIGDFHYGVDVVIPQKYEGMDEMDPHELESKMIDMIPKEHQEFAEKLLESHDVPPWPNSQEKMGLFGWTLATALPLVDESLTRPNCKMIANALGTPPKEVIEKIKSSGRVMAALCGKPKQAISHMEAGIDLIIAQGYEKASIRMNDNANCLKEAISPEWSTQLCELAEREIRRTRFEAAELHVMYLQQSAMNKFGSFLNTREVEHAQEGVKLLKQTIVAQKHAVEKGIEAGLPCDSYYFTLVEHMLRPDFEEKIKIYSSIFDN